MTSRLTELENENALLRSRLRFLEESPFIAEGIRGEEVIAEFVGGELTNFAHRVDILLPERNLKIEVKYSNLNHAVSYSVTKRWSWRDLFGRDGGKVYDRLILVGDTDKRFTEFYRDTQSPFVIFDLSYQDAIELFPDYLALQISTNPRTVRSKQGKALFRDFQITQRELKSRYRTIEK